MSMRRDGRPEIKIELLCDVAGEFEMLLLVLPTGTWVAR